MRITLELEPADIERFLHALARSHHLALDADESDVLAAAKHALDTLPIGSAPAYVRKRVVVVQRLILMLEDEAWSLPRPERTRVLETLVYFSDPEDLIPDDIEVVGLLDDAIVLELLLRRQRHVLQAYTDFCEYRRSLGEAATAADRVALAAKLARRREMLVARMRRRGERLLAMQTA
ncbi:MAG TPA: YkvA family protein [Rudaea sp.]|nr:YkvA family protein [Rudaea sp.]